ncbi:SNARE binding protein [Rhizoctonia solani AG-1 IA]|uniref:DNA damage-inducible protein 1 n=1 Tax=Thanatephorus cucumeris (strain AG1-IA) TaxID=983506 RepID=L8WJM3_THACA|nr:SNARE binding protein [Rhizoctonia solani AG-1 IA]
MKLSFATETGEVYGLEVDNTMEIESLMALLEAEVSQCGIPINEQSITHEGRELNDPKATLASAGVQDDAMLQLRRKVVVAGRYVNDETAITRRSKPDETASRGESNPWSRPHNPSTQPTHHKDSSSPQTQPELADAIQNDPQRFGELLRTHRERQRDAELAQQREIAALNSDPYNVDTQRRIEEAIRQQAVLENMEHAMEYSPEFFGRVNGVKVKAFVDSGAHPECAEQCGLLRLLDKRFAGIAKGVGTAKILGRVHSAQLKLADLHLPCAFTIMEAGRSNSFLNMVTSYPACLLHLWLILVTELPDKARHDTSADLEGSKSQTPSTSTPAPGTQPASSSATPAPAQRFPGSGSTLGSAPASNPTPNPGPPRPSSRQQPPAAQASFPEDHILTLQGFGATREQAIQLLQAAGGNLDVAAALLFQ